MPILNSSFTFEQHNDTWEPYQCPDSLASDYRGMLYLCGSILQYRRGYMHVSNHGGTGYLIDYRYDQRFITHPPPFASEPLPDNNGLQWGCG